LCHLFTPKIGACKIRTEVGYFSAKDAILSRINEVVFEYAGSSLEASTWTTFSEGNFSSQLIMNEFIISRSADLAMFILSLSASLFSMRSWSTIK